MRKSMRQMNSKIFMSMFKTILMLIPVPIAFLICIELISLQLLRENTDKYENNIFHRVASVIESDYNEVFEIIYDIKTNEDMLQDYLKKKNPNEWDRYQLCKRLQRIGNRSDLIQEIFVYFPREERGISTVSGLNIKNYHDKYYTDSYNEWISRINLVDEGYQFCVEKRNDYPYVVMSGKKYSGNIDVQIMVHLNQNYILDVLKAFCSNTKKEAFLFIEDTLIASTLSLEDKEGLLEIIVEDGEKGGLRKKWKGYISEIVKVEKSKGLIFACAMEEGVGETTERIAMILGYCAVLLCFVIMIIMAFRISKRNYVPIEMHFRTLKGEDYGHEEISYEEIERRTKHVLGQNISLNQKIQRYEEDVIKLNLCKLLVVGEMDMMNMRNLQVSWFKGRYYAVLVYIFARTETDVRQGMDALFENMDIYFDEYKTMFVLNRQNEFYFIVNGNADDAECFIENIVTNNMEMSKEMAQNNNIYFDFFVEGGCCELKDIHNVYKKIEHDIEKNKKREREQKGNCSIDGILKLINESITDANLSVASLATKLGISSSYLSRYFKQEKEMSVLEYIHMQRIELAKKIIREDESVKNKELAERVGFYDISTFIRVFKKIEGITPTQFRERNEPSDG